MKGHGNESDEEYVSRIAVRDYEKSKMKISGRLIDIRLIVVDTLVRPWIYGLSKLLESEHVAANFGKTQVLIE